MKSFPRMTTLQAGGHLLNRELNPQTVVMNTITRRPGSADLWISQYPKTSSLDLQTQHLLQLLARAMLPKLSSRHTDQAASTKTILQQRMTVLLQEKGTPKMANEMQSRLAIKERYPIQTGGV